MTDFRGAAKALHIATYSGWYRFEQRNGQWAQTEKALTFWKMTALQVDPNDLTPYLRGDRTFRSLCLCRWWRGLATGKSQRAALDDGFFACDSRSHISPAPCRPRSIAPRTAAPGRSWKACAPARTAAVSRQARS